MDSYRSSHIGEDHGQHYDAAHTNKVDSLIWDEFIKEFINGHMQACVASGGTRYLDFACGTGRVLKVGARHFGKSTGIDISEDMLAVARDRVPDAQIVCADVTRDHDAVHEEFDCVTLFRFLLNAERQLSLDVLVWLADHMPQGAVLIGNNHMKTLSYGGLLTALSNPLRGTKKNHLSRRETKQMLEASGFRVREWACYRVLPSVMGKPVFGRRAQLALEKLLQRLRLGRLGSELVFVAERV